MIILCLLSVLPLIFLTTASPVSTSISKGQCFNGDRYPVNYGKNWTGTLCYDRKGNSYIENQSIVSCCGCQKLTCLSNQTTNAEYMQIKSFWNLTISTTCCQDCLGKVFPIGSVMNTSVMEDKCGTVVTTQCVEQVKGNLSLATTSVRLHTRWCCSDSDGLHNLSTVILEPSSCSSRECRLKDGGKFAGWISSILQPGCNCCLHQGKLVADGGSVNLAHGVTAKCCLGKMMVSGGCRCVPGTCWPTPDNWAQLNQTVNGRLSKPISPIQSCLSKPLHETQCQKELLDYGRDPFYSHQFSGGTQYTGRAGPGGWIANQTGYVVAALNEDDIKEAIRFANDHNLRLVVKGTGHDVYGRSTAENSLLIWTHNMKNIKFHNDFIRDGCGSSTAQGAVTVGAGLTWMDVYAAAAKEDLYVQGGSCMSVGVVGFTIGGGYGPLSKWYGLGATNLLQATVITADGTRVVASKCSHPDLFKALRGGGYGFGVVTSLTFRTHPLPKLFISTEHSFIEASSLDAFEKLIAKFLHNYNKQLIKQQWGGQVHITKRGILSPKNWRMNINMITKGISVADANTSWTPLINWLKNPSSNEYISDWQFNIKSTQGKEYFTRANPGAKNTPYNSRTRDSFFWKEDLREVAVYWLFAFNSRLLKYDQFLKNTSLGAQHLINFIEAMPDAVFINNTIPLAIHFGMGQYGASKGAIEQLKDMPLQPSVKESFALMTVSLGVQNYSPLVPHTLQTEPAQNSTIRQIQEVCNDFTTKLDNCTISSNFTEAMNNFQPEAGAYFNMASYTEPNFGKSFWGKQNYEELKKIKKVWDPKGLFCCHYCIGHEDWEEGGMCPVTSKK